MVKALLSYILKMVLLKAETCCCYDLLIVFYIIKVMLDYKIIYILSITENTMEITQLKKKKEKRLFDPFPGKDELGCRSNFKIS